MHPKWARIALYRYNHAARGGCSRGAELYFLNQPHLTSVILFNLTHPNTNVQILLTVLHSLPKVRTRRICLTIGSIFSCWSFPLSSWHWCLIQGCYCKGKFGALHSWGPKGEHFLANKVLQSIFRHSVFAWIMRSFIEWPRDLRLIETPIIVSVLWCVTSWK